MLYTQFRADSSISRIVIRNFNNQSLLSLAKGSGGMSDVRKEKDSLGFVEVPEVHTTAHRQPAPLKITPSPVCGRTLVASGPRYGQTGRR